MKIAASILALTLTAGLLAGYFFLRNRNERKLAAQQPAVQTARVSGPPEAQIFQDEVRLKAGQALVGGTVRNISGVQLEDLSVEIELKSRTTQSIETRSVGVVPQSLRPGEDGKYALEVSPKEWSGTRVVRLRSGKRAVEIPFKPEIGEPRPPEGRPTPKVVVVPRKSKDGGFINTPDTPIRIP